VETEAHAGRYRLIEAIGRGSMGVVYRAQDPGSGAEVAVKLLAAGADTDPELPARFRREAMAASQLLHPNITRVYDFGEEGGHLYMAMELLEGADLSMLIQQGRTGGLADKVSLMAQVGSGMAFVHARGIVHRDLKPGNIHVRADGQVKIMDFGLVRVGDSNMTATGMVLGSPSYMSPELIRGQKADTRSDVFSLGATFYELLSGRRAFPGKSITQIMMAILGPDPEPLAAVAPDVPAPVAAIVQRCLRKEPAHRYQTAGELHAALEVAAAFCA
jgi:eukaryotic-like serine/threonine-protein kinase